MLHLHTGTSPNPRRAADRGPTGRAAPCGPSPRERPRSMNTTRHTKHSARAPPPAARRGGRATAAAAKENHR
ncbi:hypothetical protein GCM10023329_41740 [Streptomyces sanyensis]|uniref:Uncharacterized protein n=1 Tax=Streptomyces sanyensis TaxID=568869 RepID=A0ABP9AUR2_9ACTN